MPKRHTPPPEGEPIEFVPDPSLEEAVSTAPQSSGAFARLSGLLAPKGPTPPPKIDPKIAFGAVCRLVLGHRTEADMDTVQNYLDGEKGGDNATNQPPTP